MAKSKVTSESAVEYKPNGSDRTLTASDILKRDLRSVEVPEIDKGGLPGIIHYYPISARMVIELNSGDLLQGAEGIEKIIDRFEMTLANADGSPMFSRDQLYEVPIDSLLSILNAVVGAITKRGQAQGEA